MTGDPQAPQFNGRERRSASRFAANRPARFADAAGAGPLHIGRVVDMSPSGLRLESVAALAPGQRIEIEIETDADRDPTLLHGAVVRAAPGSDGKSAFGVACRYRIQGTRCTPRAAVPANTEPPEFEPAAGIPIAPTRRPPRRNRLIAAFLLALALWGLAGLPSDSSRSAATGNGSARTADASTLLKPVPDEFVSESTLLAMRSRAPNKAGAETDRWLSGWTRGAGAPVGTAPLNGARLHTPGEPGARSRIAPAQAPGRQSHNPSPPAFVERQIARLRPSEHEPQPVPTGADSPDEPLLIEVDASNFVLHVRRNNGVIRSFPVGLGRNDSTPLGRFVISDKMRNPDWYDRGRTVPAGSPENPLGACWMGLRNGPHAHGIGIHPAADPSSVEQPVSRGCIRLSPADAEALFRLAPSGTPVWIHE